MQAIAEQKIRRRALQAKIYENENIDETYQSEENFIQKPNLPVSFKPDMVQEESLAIYARNGDESVKNSTLLKIDFAKKVVFLHIGKAGGTSFDSAMRLLQNQNSKNKGKVHKIIIEFLCGFSQNVDFWFFKN